MMIRSGRDAVFICLAAVGFLASGGCGPFKRECGQLQFGADRPPAEEQAQASPGEDPYEHPPDLSTPPRERRRSSGKVIKYCATRFSEHCKMGVKRMKQGKYEQAAEEFELAAKEKPNDHNSCYLAGLAYEVMRNYMKAEASYDRAIILKSKEEYYTAHGRVR